MASLLFPAHVEGTRTQQKTSVVLPSPRGDPTKALLSREQSVLNTDKTLLCAGVSVSEPGATPSSQAAPHHPAALSSA